MMIDIMNIVQRLNSTMREFGFTEDLCVGNDNIKITEREVIMKIPFSLELKIPKKDFEGQSDDAISRAVSQAISQTVSRTK